MTPSLSGYLLVAGIVGSIGACAVSYTAGRASRQAEISTLTSVSAAMSARNRQITQEVRDAQQGHLAAWTTERKRADDYWMRLKADRRDGVPNICSESGSNNGDGQNSVEGDGIQSHEGQWCICR